MTTSYVPSATFLGSANWTLAAEHLKRRTSELYFSSWKIIDIPFGQYRIQLTDEESCLRKGNPNICIFCERIEDLLPESNSQYDESLDTEIYQRIEDYILSIREARSHLDGMFFIFDFSPVKVFVQSLTDTAYRDHSSLTKLVFNANQKLVQLSSEIADCHILPLSACLHFKGCENAWSLKYWSLGRFPYTPEFSDMLIDCMISAHQALLGKTARVLILDLDNTLWGGIIGDDGISGIKLGSDYPGNVFVAVQHVVKALATRGIILAICSKNTENIALQAINSHPDMILREDDFLIKKINWLPKSDNIREIAQEIGVGLSSLCFIDDSLYEREEVRSSLPEVIVPELPDDITEYADFIASLPCFASISLTEEDKVRGTKYKSRQLALSDKNKFTSKLDYLKSLQMKLSFSPISDSNKQRTLQLIAKTNQFNTTTRRHSEVELERLQSNGSHIATISLSDRYSSNEIIGVLILQPQNNDVLDIETFILSCRVLGRGIETGALVWAMNYAKANGFNALRGLFIPTERNKPAADIYSKHGFTLSCNNEYYYNLKVNNAITPEWLEVSNNG
ncbi:TPA: HAD-IIIC family phosphatase [Aeromonas hydrophila]|nr:HAD-IIIC family phosphatase [Aeromonas hydrophila]HAU4974733.1 HAD-IIIC family phosphatase [Aeromonas hydrophila]HAU4983629.1 HAD-IIIC family phosphatase [Aeromonas hydrophila]